MAKDCPMLEISTVGTEEEDNEIELSLGLSIGECFRKLTKSKPEEQKLMSSSERNNSKSVIVGDADLSREDQIFSTSSVTPTIAGDSGMESGPEYLDPQRRHEFHALKRQATLKKREEKMRRGHTRGVNTMNGGLIGLINPTDGKSFLESQLFRSRVKDREIRENEANLAERTCKRENNDAVVNEEIKDLTLTLNHNGPQNLGHGSSTAAFGSSSIPMVPVQYGFFPVQYAPVANEFAYPCVMSCWAPAVGNVRSGKNLQQPVASRSFRPYQEKLYTNHNQMTSSNSEHNSERGRGNQHAVSNGSPVGSSSAISDNRSTSQQGGSSNDIESHSNHSNPEQTHLNTATKKLEQCEYSVNSDQIESTQANNNKATVLTGKEFALGTIRSSPAKLSEPTNSETQPSLANNPNPITFQNANSSPIRLGIQNLSKPPKPESQNHNTTPTPSFSKMPCVSTTGNGPNGKTITGFLYRYTKTEVSIICVCHGSSFSPAEFVEHAGGEDVTHPLKHITVITSALGS